MHTQLLSTVFCPKENLPGMVLLRVYTEVGGSQLTLRSVKL